MLQIALALLCPPSTQHHESFSNNKTNKKLQFMILVKCLGNKKCVRMFCGKKKTLVIAASGKHLYLQLTVKNH